MIIVPPRGHGEGFLSTTYTALPGLDIQLREPMTGETIQPLVVPEVLRNWPVLQGGFDFLERHGDRIDFTLLLAPHSSGQDLVDAGVDLRAESSRVARHGGLLFLEGVGVEEQAGRYSEIVNGVSQGRMRPEDFETGDPSLRFFVDVLGLIAGTGARVENPDVRTAQSPTNNELLSPLHDMLDRWSQAIKKLGRADRTPGNSRELLIAEVGYHNYREWMIIGVIGTMLSRFKDRVGGDPIVGTLLMGSGHANMKAKIERLLGKSIRVVGERPMLTGDRYTQAVTTGLGAAALSADVLDDFHGFRVSPSGVGMFSSVDAG